MALIKCPKCYSVISDKAVNCPHCGNDMINDAYRIKARPYIKSPISETQRPKSWFVESLLLGLASLILFTIWCLPFAIASFYYALKVDNNWSIGDIDGAMIASEKAHKYYRIGLWVGIGLWLLIIGILLLLFLIGTIYSVFE